MNRRPSLVGFYNDISNIGVYGLGSYAISDYEIKDGDAEISFARGLIVSYHEAHHHNNLEVHCNDLNCVRGVMPYYQLCSFAEQWVETKIIPTCEAHKVAEFGDE